MKGVGQVWMSVGVDVYIEERVGGSMGGWVCYQCLRHGKTWQLRNHVSTVPVDYTLAPYLGGGEATPTSGSVAYIQWDLSISNLCNKDTILCPSVVL